MEVTVVDDDATDDDQHDKDALYLIPHFWREAPVLLPGPFRNCNKQISLSLHKHVPNTSLR